MRPNDTPARLAREAPADKTPEQLSRRPPGSLSDVELRRELDWHEARAALIRRHVRSRTAAASSAARRKELQVDLEHVRRVYEQEMALNTYGAVRRTAKRLGASEATIHRKLALLGREKQVRTPKA